MERVVKRGTRTGKQLRPKPPRLPTWCVFVCLLLGGPLNFYLYFFCFGFSLNPPNNGVPSKRDTATLARAICSLLAEIRTGCFFLLEWFGLVFRPVPLQGAPLAIRGSPKSNPIEYQFIAHGMGVPRAVVFHGSFALVCYPLWRMAGERIGVLGRTMEYEGDLVGGHHLHGDVSTKLSFGAPQWIFMACRSQLANLLFANDTENLPLTSGQDALAQLAACPSSALLPFFGGGFPY